MRSRLLLACISVCLLSLAARADILTPPKSLPEQILSESVPRAFAPNDLSVGDFEVERVGIDGVKLDLEENSLQWVRVGDLLVLPRARLRVSAMPGHFILGGEITSGGYTQELVPGTGVLAEIPVALVTGASNAITLSIRERTSASPDRGEERHGDIRIRLKLRRRTAGAAVSPAVAIDSGCSRFGIQAQSTGDAGDEWLYVGCRLVAVKDSEHRTSSLELLVFWDGAKPDVFVGGEPTSPVVPSVWALRLRPEPGSVELASGEHRVRLTYSIPEDLHFGSLGVGLGPYLYSLQSQTATTQTPTALLTLYGSYFVSEQMRFIAFDATSFANQWYTDLGFYLETEEVRALDQRLSINLMLGAHVIGFETGNQFYVRPGLPQGIEATFYDAFARGWNATIGGFVYPEINGTSYYNIWLRYGSTRYFVELNYITWHETVNDYELFSKSVGVSVGMPLARFL